MLPDLSTYLKYHKVYKTGLQYPFDLCYVVIGYHVSSIKFVIDFLAYPRYKYAVKWADMSKVIWYNVRQVLIKRIKKSHHYNRYNYDPLSFY